MYIDLFTDYDHEVSLVDLTDHLRDMGVHQANYKRYLSHASVLDMVQRTGRNILNCVNTRQDLRHQQHFSDPEDFLDEDEVICAVLWMSIIFGASDAVETIAQRRNYARILLGRVDQYFPWDAPKLEQIVLELFRGRMESTVLQQAIRSIKDRDSNPNDPVYRSKETDKLVQYNIGHLFKHKRYGYQAAIVTWDVKCDASEDWQVNNRISSLPSGGDQPFYLAIAEDKSSRYVAQENIELTDGPPSEKLLRHAGRWFRRWDHPTGRFVSNLKHLFPDD